MHPSRCVMVPGQDNLLCFPEYGTRVRKSIDAHRHCQTGTFLAMKSNQPDAACAHPVAWRKAKMRGRYEGGKGSYGTLADSTRYAQCDE